jgi:hypothetical protein
MFRHAVFSQEYWEKNKEKLKEFAKKYEKYESVGEDIEDIKVQDKALVPVPSVSSNASLSPRASQQDSPPEVEIVAEEKEVEVEVETSVRPKLF